MKNNTVKRKKLPGSFNLYKPYRVIIFLIISILISSTSVSSSSPLSSSLPSSETSNQADRTKVHFVNVGHGDAILIQSNQQNILIDGGKEIHNDTVVDYLKKSGVEKIDLLIVSHMDPDHIGGLPKVINTFPIGEILHNGKTAANSKFETAVNSQGCPLRTAVSGIKYQFGKAVLEILGPVIDDPKASNNNSIVCKLTCDKVRFLFIGDAESPEQESILDKPIEADILKAPHHGIVYNPYDGTISQNSKFLKKVAPKVAIVSRPTDKEDIRFALNWPLMVSYYYKCGIYDIRSTNMDNNICIETDGNTYN